MRELIEEKLKEIEVKENVRIIYCAESGSRAWGFASPDSDYDVRFIYVRPKEFYLKLEKTRNVIEWQLDETLDINGWDIKKALCLLHNCNPTLFEWNGSPIVYRTTDEWKLVADKINDYFVGKSGLHHYLSTAKSNYREYLIGERVRLKKYLYVLRPILACKWILAENTPPPMLFTRLMEKYLEDDMKAEVNEILRIKRETPEIGECRRIDRVNDYIERSLEELDRLVLEYPSESKGDWESLNRIFLSLL